MTVTSRTPTNWSSFLRDANNKTKLFHSIADKLSEAETTSTFVVTKEKDVISNKMFPHVVTKKRVPEYLHMFKI